MRVSNQEPSGTQLLQNASLVGFGLEDVGSMAGPTLRIFQIGLEWWMCQAQKPMSFQADRIPRDLKLSGFFPNCRDRMRFGLSRTVSIVFCLHPCRIYQSVLSFVWFRTCKGDACERVRVTQGEFSCWHWMNQKQIDKEASGHTILISFVKRKPSITFLISGFSAGVAFQSGNFALVSFLFLSLLLHCPVFFLLFCFVSFTCFFLSPVFLKYLKCYFLFPYYPLLFSICSFSLFTFLLVSAAWFSSIETGFKVEHLVEGTLLLWLSGHCPCCLFPYDMSITSSDLACENWPFIFLLACPGGCSGMYSNYTYIIPLKKENERMFMDLLLQAHHLSHCVKNCKGPFRWNHARIRST